jgi:hypothetical protein
MASGRGRGLAAVVRLHATRGKQCIGALGECRTDQELELAGLVAAEAETGRVVALDQDLRPAEVQGEPS